MEKNILEMIEYPVEGVISKKIFRNDKIDLGLFCMAKGTEMSEHTSTRLAFVQVIEGEGTFILSGRDIVMKPGVHIFMNAHEVHSLKAEENLCFVLGLY